MVKKRRVVITGLGVVSSLGIGWKEFWKNLLAGKSGISRISSFDTSQYDRHFAGEIKNFDPKSFISPKKLSRIGRTSQLAIAASKLALQDAEFQLSDDIDKSIGICIGTTMGEPKIVEHLDEKYFSDNRDLEVDFYSALTYPASSITANVARELRVEGQNLVFGNACSAGNYATAYSFDLIRNGLAECMLVGGADAFSRIAFTGFSRLFAIAPEKCQPFDKNRKGMIPGEGAASILLESYDNAKKRGANIYAEILGYGLSCDAHHMTAPNVRGVERAIVGALKNSQISVNDIGYVSAHGTGTKENDKIECQAYRNVFGEKCKDIPISSIKSMLGHTMGAASALETGACCLAVKNKWIPPTINYNEKDLDCDIDCVPDLARQHEVYTVLNNSQAFGGNNACLVLGVCK